MQNDSNSIYSYLWNNIFLFILKNSTLQEQSFPFSLTPPPLPVPRGGGGSSAPKDTPKPTTNFTDEQGSVRTSHFTIVSCNQGFLLQDALVLN